MIRLHTASTMENVKIKYSNDLILVLEYARSGDEDNNKGIYIVKSKSCACACACVYV